MDAMNTSTFTDGKQSRRNDYKKKLRGKLREKIRQSRKDGCSQEKIDRLCARLNNKDVKPEGAFAFESQVLTSVFGTKNIVFFSSFLAALNTSTSWKNTVAVVTMYLSQVVGSDVVDLLMEEFDSLRIKPEAGLEEVWTTAKSASGVFKSFKNTELFKRLRDVVTLCVVSGIVDTTAKNFSANALSIFNVKASAKIPNPADLLDLVMKTVVYFAESGYRIFASRDATFLFEPIDVMTDYQKVIEYWPMCKTGNLMRIHNMDSRDFGNLLASTQKMLESAVREAVGPEKALYLRMSNQLTSIKSEYLQCKTDGKLRQAPLVVCIIGDSSVGKSTISNMLAVTLLKAMNRPCSADRIRTYNPTDKYDSWADGLTECLICDDLGALKPEFSDVNPVDFLIRIKNNAPMTATKADVDEKGKIPIDVSLVVVTMNSMESLTVGAACPTAVLRRFDFCVRPFVKPQFRKDPHVNQLSPQKVIKEYGAMSGAPNVWDFQIIKPEIKMTTMTTGDAAYFNRFSDFKPTQMNTTESEVEWKMVDKGDTPFMLKYAIAAAKEHKMIQTYVVDTNTTLASSIEICEECGNVCDYCDCVKPEFGFSLAWTEIAEAYHGFSPLAIASQIPSFLVHSKYTSILMDMIFARHLIQYYKRQSMYLIMYWCFVISFVMKMIMYSNEPWMVFLAILFVYEAFCVFCTIVQKARDKAYDEILKSTFDFRRFTRVIYDYRVKAAGLICVAAYGLYKFYRMYKFAGLVTESALEPTSKQEANERLDAKSEWARVEVEELPVTTKCMTMTVENVCTVARKNLVHVEWSEDGVRHYCDGFFPTSNYVLLPTHMLPKNSDVKVTFQRAIETVVNSDFKSYCNFAHAVKIPRTDFSLVQVQSAPSFKSVLDLFPTERDYLSHVVTEIHRKRDGSIEFDNYRAKMEYVSNNAQGAGIPVFLGSMHQVGKPTFDGRCMSVLVAHARFPYIHGFHLGGNNKLTGVSGTLFRSQIKDAIGSMTFVLPEAASGDMPEEICGVKLLTSKKVHERCATNFLPVEESNTIEVYGSTIGASTPHSDVIPTMISDKVTEVTGYENKWGPPPFNSRRDHSVALQTAANNSHGFAPSALEWAINDYIEPLIAKFKEVGVEIRPLTHMETINGVPGVRFVDKIVRNTSIGFPRSGKKNKFMKELPPNDIWQDPVDLDDVTMEEVERMMACYRRGERAYSPAKTSLKDEPTKLTKTKCRIFYVTNTALQYLVRKYYLMICAAYSTFPLMSNCAVGINRQGLEWEELSNFIRGHGDERIFAGDHSKFDLNMPCQIVRAAFACHLRVAEAFGYSDDDLMIMKGLAADLCNPVVAWNGTLIQLGSLHMSGNNLTVYNGSVANSLYVRCHFYEQGHSDKNFRDYVNLVCYGDDITGSVSPELKNFNHITFADYLAEHGIKFTMPDKESIATEFLKYDEADFLKCLNRFDPDIGHDVAQLSEDSIFKSLHSVLESSVLSKEEVAAQNIDGALREWFFHGREKFDLRQKQMKKIAAETGLEMYCQDLNTTFDQRVRRWKEKYEPDDIKPECGTAVDFDTVEHWSHCNGALPWYTWESYFSWVNALVVFLFAMWLLYNEKCFIPVLDKRWAYFLAYSLILETGNPFSFFFRWIYVPTLLVNFVQFVVLGFISLMNYLG